MWVKDGGNECIVRRNMQRLLQCSNPPFQSIDHKPGARFDIQLLKKLVAVAIYGTVAYFHDVRYFFIGHFAAA